MWANSANKFFDALASGKPVAINYGGWQADLLESAGAGLRLPANDPELAFALLDQVSGRLVQAVEDAGRAARRLAEEKFNRESLARQLESVLLERG